MATPSQQVQVGVGVFILQSPFPSSNPSFLIGKRIGSHGANTYALPGGHLEFQETPSSCASREVLEETGLAVQNLRFLTATNDVMKAEGKHYVTLFMVCERTDEGCEAQVLEKEKCEGWEWVTWDAFMEMVSEGKNGVGGRKLFLPLLDLVEQRPGVIPSLL